MNNEMATVVHIRPVPTGINFAGIWRTIFDAYRLDDVNDNSSITATMDV